MDLKEVFKAARERTDKEFEIYSKPLSKKEKD